MSLEKIQLPDFILADLFKNHLVLLKNTKLNKDTLPKPSIQFLGSNLKYITILIKNTEAIYMKDEHLNFLSGILTACKMNFEDIALINLYKTPAINYPLIIQECCPSVILFFGIVQSDIELPFKLQDFQVLEFNDHLYLSAPGLDAIQSDKILKQQLWSKLKEIFVK